MMASIVEDESLTDVQENIKDIKKRLVSKSYENEYFQIHWFNL